MPNAFWLILVGALMVLAFIWFFLKSRRPQEVGDESAMRFERIGDGLRRLEENKRRYAHMTPALLAETEDDDLLEAVLSNLWAKMRPDLSDAQAVMTAQTAARRMLYGLYWVTGEIKQDGFAMLEKDTGDGWFPLALDALDALGMEQSASLLRSAMEAPDAERYRDPYLETFQGEAGKARMVAYIRSQPDAFVDDP